MLPINLTDFVITQRTLKTCTLNDSSLKLTVEPNILRYHSFSTSYFQHKADFNITYKHLQLNCDTEAMSDLVLPSVSCIIQICLCLFIYPFFLSHIAENVSISKWNQKTTKKTENMTISHLKEITVINTLCLKALK